MKTYFKKTYFKNVHKAGFIDPHHTGNIDRPIYGLSAHLLSFQIDKYENVCKYSTIIVQIFFSFYSPNFMKVETYNSLNFMKVETYNSLNFMKV